MIQTMQFSAVHSNYRKIIGVGSSRPTIADVSYANASDDAREDSAKRRSSPPQQLVDSSR